MRALNYRLNFFAIGILSWVMKSERREKRYYGPEWNLFAIHRGTRENIPWANSYIPMLL